MIKKIAVLGTGANGSSAAADLVAAGLDVVLIDQWPAHVESMRVNGLTINMPDKQVKVPVEAYHMCEVCTLNQMYDVVLLFAKAYDTRWFCEFIKPYLQPNGLLIGVQNAMTVPDITAIVGPERTLGCVVELSSEIFEPGVVQRNTPPEKSWFGIGAIDGMPVGREPEIQDILRHIGKVSISENILSAKWMKLVVNTMCLGPIAMLGQTLHEAATIPGMRELNLSVGSEALAIGQELGYGIEPIFGLREDDIRDTNRLLEKLLDKLSEDIGPAARDCVLQDHLKGRYSEVDLINGLVVEESQKQGIYAPANASIVEITRRIQSGKLAPSPDNLKLATDLLQEHQKSRAS